jgi:8-oxo-dGTP diphosphatase
MVNGTPVHSVAVAGVLIDEQGRALLVRRRDNGRWEPPGGVLQPGESIWDGLRREVLEETGLQVEPDRLTGVYKNMSRGVVALAFRCTVTGGQLTVNEEATEFRWAHPAEIPSLTNEMFTARLLDGYRADPAPVIRHHDGTRLLTSLDPPEASGV